MTDRDALLAAVCALPAEGTPRLVLADWFQENGEPERAEFVRVQCELARIPCQKPGGCSGCLPHSEALRSRERELLSLSWSLGWQPWKVKRVRPDTGFVFSRGFVAELTSTAADFLAHADALLWHPKQTVPCQKCDGGVYLPDRDWGRCVCSGTGRVPRPCPPTAQPVTRVTLSTVPRVNRSADGLFQVPGVRENFEVPGGRWMADRELAAAILAIKWPWVTFGWSPLVGRLGTVTVGGETLQVTSWTLAPGTAAGATTTRLPMEWVELPPDAPRGT